MRESLAPGSLSQDAASPAVCKQHKMKFQAPDALYMLLPLTFVSDFAHSKTTLATSEDEARLSGAIFCHFAVIKASFCILCRCQLGLIVVLLV